MKRTGEILKKAREQKGLSINEIALSLKISSKVLKAIEDGDANQLPAKTFLRGFVQSYANYLRLDVNEVLRIFQDEMGTTKPSPLIQMPEQDSTLESMQQDKKGSESTQQTPRGSTPAQEKTYSNLANKNSNSKTVTFTALGLVLVGLIVFTKKMIDKYQKEGAVSEVEVTTPLPPSEATPEPNAPAAEAAMGLAQPSPSPMATAMSTPLSTPTPFHTPAATATPVATATPKVTPTPTPVHSATPTPTPKPSPSPTATPTATPTPSPSPSASPTVSPTPANKPVEVILEALDNVEVEVSTKDGKTEKITLSAEQVHTFKSKTGLKLNISNGGAVNVIVNGKDLGIPGNLGKPVKLNF
ncbi:MAG: helix-turn-helix domain-containing protein [Bdellovibrionales bacterium]|nr:helix-turn-helix domain-containing protein [Bdellovibrionales bacterium]